ncbi:MAG TPA: hypothetical protein VK324_10330, partial [Tepidisphaeraceae bacterium]|nr:hypothetical protein [Tepidisphaeraceae bacterium]
RVKARAGQDGDCVYALAQVRPPAKKSPLGKPGSPTAMTAELSAATGALALTWRCRQPEGSKGVLYDVWRRIGDNGAFEYLGSTGRKTFVDQTLPPGAGRVMYRIVARRSTKVGDAAEFPVNLGVSPAVAEMLRAATQDERGTARVPPAAMAA